MCTRFSVTFKTVAFHCSTIISKAMLSAHCNVAACLRISCAASEVEWPIKAEFA